MRLLQLAAICVVSGLFAVSGHAAEEGFYVGAAIGETETRHRGGLGDVFDDQDSAFKIIGGWRPVDWFAIEGSYFDLGDVTLFETVPDLSPFRLEQRGYDAFGVFLLEIGTFDLFAKAGIVKSAADLTINTIAGPASSVDHDTDFAWGAGAQAWFGKVAARLEYERLQISNGDGFRPPKMISLGITWTF